MISASEEPAQDRTFEIRPNCSLSRRGSLLFFIVVTVVSALLCIRFWLLGAWLVMPFFVLEVVVLGIALYLLARGSEYREIINISSGQILITAKNGNQQLWQEKLNLFWVEVVLEADEKEWYPSRLYLRSHGKFLQIGKCLTDDDRSGLAQQLRKVLAQHQTI